MKDVKRDENPSAFKLMLNKSLLERMAKSLHKVYPAFDQNKFVQLAKNLDPLELKDRVRLIRDQLHQQLPSDYPKAVKILVASAQSETMSGFDLWPYSDFVQTFGLEHLDVSLKALYDLTSLFTSEFAIRPFILKHPKETMKFLLAGASDKDVHIRRWASEGSRPRLPWGAKIGPFILDPKPTLPILEKLKHDEELYVRKSVSNHLNDIAKDHPEFVIQVLRRWQKEAGDRHADKITWIIQRSLRTLIKDGHPGALQLIGADHKAKIKVSGLSLQKKKFSMNDKIEFSFKIQSEAKKSQKIVVDYVIHHMKSNKETSPKVFKLKTLTLKPGEVFDFKKQHHLKPITTRKYYPGAHALEIQVNGKIYARADWTLQAL